jgi:hypothetical protein
VLDPLEHTGDTEAQWQQLGEAALDAVTSATPGRVLPLLKVAERCYAAISNLSRAAYLRRVSEQYKAGLAGDSVATVRAEVRTHSRVAPGFFPLPLRSRLLR